MLQFCTYLAFKTVSMSVIWVGFCIFLWARHPFPNEKYAPVTQLNKTVILICNENLKSIKCIVSYDANNVAVCFYL